MLALFFLALHPALEGLRAILPPDEHTVAYLDDIYIVCEQGQVVSVTARANGILQRICHIDISLGKLAVGTKKVTNPNLAPN